MTTSEYKRKTCPPIKDKRPKGMRSVPVIGYTLTQLYAQESRLGDLVAEVLKGLSEGEGEPFDRGGSK